jgi:hypothetical protein
LPVSPTVLESSFPTPPVTPALPDNVLNFNQLLHKTLSVEHSLPPNTSISNFIVGDGSCGFRAISYCTYRSQDYHRELRSLCVSTIKQYREIFATYMQNNEDIDSFCHRMSLTEEDLVEEPLSSIFMEDVCVDSLCIYLKSTVALWTRTSLGLQKRTYTPNDCSTNLQGLNLYFEGGHYEVLLSKPHSPALFPIFDVLKVCFGSRLNILSPYYPSTLQRKTAMR